MFSVVVIVAVIPEELNLHYQTHAVNGQSECAGPHVARDHLRLVRNGRDRKGVGQCEKKGGGHMSGLGHDGTIIWYQ